MGCGCPEPAADCDCADEPASPLIAQHPVGDLVSGGTGMSMRRFKSDPRQPTQHWTGFRRPVQDLSASSTLVAQAGPAGTHLQSLTVDGKTGVAVSLMGDPTSEGSMYPADPFAALGYEFPIGRRP